NGPSDSALFGGMSHEHVESITDPEPNNAWTDWGAFTGEICDKCSTFVEATEFGTPIGEVDVEGKKRKYNHVINGHKYWYQQEWSNKGHECLQRLTFEASEAPTAKFTSATVNGNEVKFDATGSTAGANVRYTWQFNDFSGHHENETQETEELTINHKFSSAGLYTVALTVLETDGASIGTAQALVVGKTQTIKFTSPAPSSATVGGATYTAAATATSGLAVAFAIDASSSSVCTILGSTVSFIGAGKCIIDANQAGNSKYAPAPEVKQEFEVAKGSQTIMFTSTAPGSATVGGPTYNVTATGGGSGNPVTFAIDATSGSVCTISGSTVSFTGVGTCTIDADQAGNPGYSAAPQAQQSFSVAAPESTATVSETSTLTGKLTPELTPNSNFALGNATVNPTTGAITFTESVGDPGTFSWLATFQNGRFGVFAARGANCKRGFVRLIGKCRPARIVFARGSKTVAAPGSVSFTLKPSASAVKALRNALKHKRGLLISVRLTFQSSLGGSPVSHTRSLAVRLKKG
ncbi:MAG TPA: PKD domain-containing protein, partial [Solirubrobacteraceae bacterium]|nr:PKD domain-containing protein [Solirubrobacteraceae bacterium]